MLVVGVAGPLRLLRSGQRAWLGKPASSSSAWQQRCCLRPRSGRRARGAWARSVVVLGRGTSPQPATTISPAIPRRVCEKLFIVYSLRPPSAALAKAANRRPQVPWGVRAANYFDFRRSPTVPRCLRRTRGGFGNSWDFEPVSARKPMHTIRKTHVERPASSFCGHSVDSICTRCS